MGNRSGAIKSAAARVGVSVEEYAARTLTGEKWCTSCKAWRNRGEFALDRSRGDGLKSTCRTHGARADGQPTKPERSAAALRGEAWCSRCNAWLPIEEVRGGRCRPHVNEYAREHYLVTEGRGRRGRASARRRKVGWVGTETRERLYETTEGRCVYGCGRTATALDHVIPVARGGRTGPGNMVPACTPCNSSKSDRDPWPWIMRLGSEFRHLVEPGLTYDGAILDLAG